MSTSQGSSGVSERARAVQAALAAVVAAAVMFFLRRTMPLSVILAGAICCGWVIHWQLGRPSKKEKSP